MDFDVARGVGVLFGGRCDNATGASCYLSDTWEWNGVDWQQRFPTTSPPVTNIGGGGNNFALVYDSARRLNILFEKGSTESDAVDVWEWDGVNWLHRNVSNAPRLAYYSAAYDSDRQRTVLVGYSSLDCGCDRGLTQTWEFDGTDWLLRQPPSAPPSNFPSLAFDAQRHVSVLLQGDGFGHLVTWEWDGTTWTQVAQTFQSPPGRSGFSLSYDSLARKVVLFGGYSGVQGNMNDTWEWDGASWSEVSFSNVPYGRSAPGVAFDGVRGKTVFFGGYISRSNYLETQGETWLLSLAPQQAPSRYVALGDSVSFGQGLANPDYEAHPESSGALLPINEGPALLSFPALLARDEGFQFDVRYGEGRVTLDANTHDYAAGPACIPAEDHLAIGGADSGTANTAPLVDAKGKREWSEVHSGYDLATDQYESSQPLQQFDDDCPDAYAPIMVRGRRIGWRLVSTLPHKSLDEELTGAHLESNPPGLVTILIGANDIRFPDCLGGMLKRYIGSFWDRLKFSVFMAAHDIHAQDCTDPQWYQNHLQRRLDFVRDHLENYVLPAIERAAPAAKIALLTYYQPVPPPNASISAVDSLCKAFAASSANARAGMYYTGLFLSNRLYATINQVHIDRPETALVDLTAAFAGHELCTANPFVFSMLPNGGSDPWALIHPNENGQKMIACQVENQLGLAVIRDGC